MTTRDDDARTRFYDGMPWHVRAVFFLGVPSVISLGLVWLMAMNIQQRVVNIETKLDVYGATFSRHVGESESRDREMLRLMLAMCYNAAKTDQDRDRCAR